MKDSKRTKLLSFKNVTFIVHEFKNHNLSKTILLNVERTIAINDQF
jgi:hypothetical protein